MRTDAALEHATAAPAADPPPQAAPARARPFDPRLTRYARATRPFLVASVVLGALTAGLVISQAWLLASLVAGAFVHHRDLADQRGAVVALLAVVTGRGAVSWASERAAFRASASAKSDLRLALADKVAELGPQGLGSDRTGELAVLASTGIDALDAYFARYLPQLVLAVVVPVAVVAVVAGADWISALIIAATVPLVPYFMALVGASTRRRTERRIRALQRLAGHFLDVVAGLPTLKVFGRAEAQADVIRRATEQYGEATMGTLRVAFLSSLVLELLSTISVALVAVAVGLRLLGGHLGFETALFVLVLAPEAYLPLRALGTTYHASADGVAAAARIFDILDRPSPPRGTCTEVPDLSRSPIRVEGLEVRRPGRTVPALHDLSLSVEPGEVLAVAGPSGCGKSTLLGVLLGMVPVTGGSVTVGGVELSDLDPDAWRAHVSWVPQHPHLFAASIADNIRLGRPGATDQEVRRAVTDAGLDEVVARLPQQLDTRLGEGGAGLSAGERQRVALARAFVRRTPLLLLDEPTSNLDGDAEAAIIGTVRRLVGGRTVVMAAHRPALLEVADRVLWLPGEGAIAEDGPGAGLAGVPVGRAPLGASVPPAAFGGPEGHRG